MDHRTPHAARIALAQLAGATVIGSFGLAAGGVAGALVAAHASGTGSTSGLPLAALALGSALSIIGVARYSRRVGRRPALAAGYLLGVVGALIVIAATAGSNLGLVLVGSVLLGGPNAAVFLTRYAAADVVDHRQRGRALGLVLGCVTVGAVGGTYLLGPTAHVAEALGLPAVVGLYLLAVPAFLTAGLVLARGGRREPVPGPERRERAVLYVMLGIGPLRRAGVLLATANLAMTAAMVVLPIHLTHHGHGLHLVGGLVALHVAGMFLPSPFSGWLADRIGGERVGRAGLAIIIVTVAGWAATGATDAPWSGVLLMTLGVGWNAAVVGGSALIATTTRDASNGIEVEAGAELAKEAGAGIGAPVAGLVAALFGFPVLCLLVGAACTLGLAATGRRVTVQRQRAGRDRDPGNGWWSPAAATQPRQPHLHRPADQLRSAGSRSWSGRS